MKQRNDSKFAPILIAAKAPTPRFGVLPTRREAPKKGEFNRKVKHCARDAGGRGVFA